MVTKTKTIDLGALQDALAAAKKQYAADVKAVERAMQAADISKSALSAAVESLKAATRTVLDQ